MLEQIFLIIVLDSLVVNLPLVLTGKEGVVGTCTVVCSMLAELPCSYFWAQLE